MNYEVYKGIIVEESLEDNRTLNNIPILGVKVTEDEKPEDRWHLYTVGLPRENIPLLKNKIKEGWYTHFWRGQDLLVIFRNKLFILDANKKASWKTAVEYGLKQGIAPEQLNFAIEN